MKHFLILFLLFICFQSPAQIDDIKFEHISVEQGLSHGMVTCILQDKEGFMWFGTRDGLNKYDGYSFTLYEHDPSDTNSISNNSIRSIYEDTSGALWIGTYIGLNKFDKKTNSFTRYLNNPSNKNSISDNEILEIYEDRQGILWIGTYMGLNKYDPQTYSFTLYEHYPNHSDKWTYNMVHTIYEDKRGNLWIGTTQGLSLFDRKKETFTRFPYSPHPATHPNYPVKAILEDKQGVLWVGTQGDGLKAFNRANHSFTTYKGAAADATSSMHKSIISLYQDSFGTFWVGTQHEGLNKFDRKTGVFTHYVHNPIKATSISDNTIQVIYEDRSHVLWVGAFGGGINKVDLLRKKITHFKSEATAIRPLTYYVSDLYVDRDGSVWIGKATGLDKLDRNTGNYTSYSFGSPSSQNRKSFAVRCIYEDRGENLWIGFDEDGLKKFDRKKDQIVNFEHNPSDSYSLPSNLINTIYEDKKRRLWLGTRDGLAKFNASANNFTTYKALFIQTRRFNVVSILEDSLGVLWLATTDNGILKFNPATNTFTKYLYKSKKRLRGEALNWLYEDKKGLLWAGLATGGLLQFDRKSATFTAITEPKALSKTIIMGIKEDDRGNVWLSTKKNGIYRFNPVTKDLRGYDIKDGLQGNEFNKAFYKSSRGEMYVGGTNGFNIFHPDSIKDNPYAPQIAISGFKVFDKPRSFADHITLPYRDNFFSFDFAALSYALAEKNQYQYQLEGFDKEWVKAGTRRYASYTNLDPGEYVFKVKAANHDGVWNQKGASVKVTILPPFWKTSWAYGVYALAIIGILLGLRQYTIAQERLKLSREKLKNELELQQREKEKLQELDQLKTRFFTNVSHEFRTPLTLIKGPLDTLLAGETDEKQRKVYYGLMSKNTQRLYELINQLLDLSKLEAKQMSLQASPGDIVAFIKAIVFSFHSHAQSKKIDLCFRQHPEEVLALFDKDRLEKILCNLLSNAIKFTPESGTVTVSLSIKPAAEKKQWVELSIQDTGIGIAADRLNKIFDRFYQVDSAHTREYEGTGIGLALTKELVELHGGKIRVSSQPGIGTSFTVALPLEIVQDEDVATYLEEEYDRILPVLNEGAEAIKIVSEENTQKLIKESPLLLLVEDNIDVRKYIHSIFRDSYRILEAENGEEGLKLAQEHIPDIIISDWMMPKMDGVAMCERVKTDEHTSHIPVILLTARASVESKLEGLETGADDYITKPFHTEELALRVKNLLEGRRKLRERFSRELTLQPAEVTVNSTDEKFLQKLLTAIEANLSDPDFSIELLEKEVGMSHTHFHRKVKALTNQAPGEILRSFRLKRAASLLAQNFGNVSEIAYQVGFNSVSYFTKCFREVYGVSPSKYVPDQHKQNIE